MVVFVICYSSYKQEDQFFFKDLFLLLKNMCMWVCGYVHMSTDAWDS